MINGTKANRDQIMTRAQAKKAKEIEVNTLVKSEDFSDSSNYSSLEGSPTLSWPDTSSFDVFLGLGHDALDKYPPTFSTEGWDFDWISSFISDPQDDLLSSSLYNFPLEILGETIKSLQPEKVIGPDILDTPFEISADMPIDPDQFFADNMNINESAPLVSFVDDGSKKDEDKAQVSKTQESDQLAKTPEPITLAFKATIQSAPYFPVLTERKSKLEAIEKMRIKRPF